ncbi:MAG: WD40 repeat domain-containing protein, partial [Longimicrobiales bacterium]
STRPLAESPRTTPSPAPADAGTLYHAAIIVAEASLRLHETDRAKEWLARAPAADRGWEWRYLTDLSDRSAAVVPLEGGAVADLTVSPDGRWVAAAMADGRTHLLEASNGDVVRTFEGHTASAWTPVFTRDGRRLATASSDGTARVWELAPGRVLLEMPGNGRGVAAVAWSPDESHLAVSSWDRTPERGVFGTLNVYDTRTGERLRHIEHGNYPIASLTYTADGDRLIGGTWDWDLVVWDTHAWLEPRVLSPPESPDYKRIEDFALSPDGTRLAVAHADARVRIWDLDRLEIERTLWSPMEGALKNISDVVHLGAGERIATVGGDLTVRLWDATTGDLLAAHHGHDRPILTAAAAPDGRWLYTGGSGGRMRLWDLDALDPARAAWPIPPAPDATDEGSNTVYDVAFDPAHRHAVVTTFGGWLRIIDAETGKEVRGWKASEQATVGVDWSPDGRWIASTGNDGRVAVWDAGTGARVVQLLEAERQLLNVAFDPSGALLASPGDGASVHVWRVPSWQPMAKLTDGTGSVTDIAWNRDGLLAAAYTDGKVRLWDVQRGTLERVVEAGDRGTPAITFDPSGGKLAVVLGRSARIWDIEAQRWMAQWTPRSANARSIAWSPDGARIAAAMAGNTFEVWHAETQASLLRLTQAATAWLVMWRSQDDLVLVPLDGTVRVLRATPSDVAIEAAAPNGMPQDSSEWKRRLGYVADRGGTWLTSNEEHRTQQNQEAHRYGMRYSMGLGGSAQHGCLWGEWPDREPIVFWTYFTAWDPTRQQLLLQQSGANGVIGLGYETPGTGIADQRFTAPDGTTWDQRHVTTMTPPDTLVTRSFQKEDGSWEPRRTYRWVRQPSGTPAPC